MQFAVTDPHVETWTFILLFSFILLLTIKPKLDATLSAAASTELKGFAIFAVLFAHIGYGLSKNPDFLFPLSVFAGAGLNIFLFISGFGLALEASKQDFSLRLYYQKRLQKMYLPLWITLLLFWIADSFLLHIRYTPSTIAQSILGIFPTANLFTSFNAPLWYFTFIMANYLLFPLVFIKRAPWISAGILLAIGWIVAIALIPVDPNVRHLYQLHIAALPLGVLAASLRVHLNALRKNVQQFPGSIRAALLLALAAFIAFTAIHGNIGEVVWREELASILMMLGTITFFILKPFSFGLFQVFGTYSYEIYLIHWPLLYQYDTLYLQLPAFLATATAIAVIAFLSVAFQYSWRNVIQQNNRKHHYA